MRYKRALRRMHLERMKRKAYLRYKYPRAIMLANHISYRRDTYKDYEWTYRNRMARVHMDSMKDDILSAPMYAVVGTGCKIAR